MVEKCPNCGETIIEPNETNLVPEKPGIYKGYNLTSKGNLRLTYIGESKNLKKRLNNRGLPCTHYTWEVTRDRKRKEKELIKKHQPQLNVKYRDKYEWDDEL